MTAPIFQTHELCKVYHGSARNEVRALDDVSLTIERGSFAVLSGPSGSGKTTLLAILGALERPSRGKVFFAGEDLTGWSDAARSRMRRRLGFVFQDFALIGGLTAAENITYPLIPRGVPRGERLGCAHELLTRLGIADKVTVPARQLSGGEQQRVAIARALAGQPEVILADEPTSNLDPDTGRNLLEVFEQLHAAGATLVMSSHDPTVAKLATQVIELEKGRVKAHPS